MDLIILVPMAWGIWISIIADYARLIMMLTVLCMPRGVYRLR